MISFRRRYCWWLLLLFAVAGLASWFLWPKAVMRERYERIRIGMTQAEVTEIMGAEQSEPKSFRHRGFGMWTRFASEPPLEAMKGVRIDHQGCWYDPSVESGVYEIGVHYLDGKTVFKYMKFRMTLLEIKLHEWLYWLRYKIS